MTVLESEIAKLKQEIVQYGSVCKVQEQKISQLNNDLFASRKAQ